MPNMVFKFLLFLSSYFPLSLIMFVLYFNKEKAIAISILFVGLIGLIGIHIYLKMVLQLGSIKVKVIQYKRKDDEAVSYIVTYVVPFLSEPSEGFEKGIALILFFLVVGVLYINSNMIHINPMLNLSGYHLYEITNESNQTYSLISKKGILDYATLDVVKIGDKILLEKKI